MIAGAAAENPLWTRAFAIVENSILCQLCRGDRGGSVGGRDLAMARNVVGRRLGFRSRRVWRATHMYKSTHSLLLAGVNRRSFLKSSAALGLGAVASPVIVSSALSSSGELSIINWDDELPDPVIPDFEKATGIKVNSTPFSQNEEQINKLQATGGEGFDVCQPTHDRSLQFKDIDVLQPIDPAKFDPTSVVVPGLLSASTKNWTWDGKLYHVPHVWGTEAISWRNDLTKISPEELSFGTLWSDE